MGSRGLWLLGGAAIALLMMSGACDPGDATDGAGVDPIATELPTPVGTAIRNVPRVPATPIPSTTPRTPRPTPRPGSVSVSGKPVDGEANFGGTLITATSEEGRSYNTWEESEGIAFASMHPLYNMLVQPRTWGAIDDFQRDAFLEIHPDLASGWTMAADGLSVTFTLHEGMEWSDGAPITCRDVAWSFSSIQTGEGLIRSPRKVHMNAVERVSCPNNLTVLFTLNRAKPAILEVIAQPFNIIRPQHIYADDTAALRDETPTVTSGPFTLSQAFPRERFTYRRNADYWDAPLPYLAGLELVVMPESAMLAAMRTGTVHIGKSAGFTREDAQMLEAECEVCQFWPRAIAIGHSHYVMLNHTKPPWNNPKIKEAIALAIDNSKYIRTVQGGWHIPPTACGLYPASFWAMPIERCTSIPGYGDFSTTSSPQADKARARAILEDQGYTQGEHSLTVVFGTETREDVTAIISDLQAIGVNAESKLLDDDEALAVYKAGEFDAAVHSAWTVGVDPDILLYEHFYTGGVRNYSRYSNANFDRMVDAMSVSVDPEARRQLAWDALELALREQAKIIVSHGVFVPIFNDRVRGLMPSLDYLAEHGPQLRYDHAWLAG